MTGWSIYWIMKLDGLCGILAIAGVLCIVAGLVYLLNSRSDGEEPKEGELSFDLKEVSPKIYKLGIAALILWLTAAMLPSTQAGMAMYVLPKVSRGEILSPEFSKTVKETLHQVFKEDK